MLFDADNPDAGDGFCLWCVEEMRYTPAELALLRAERLGPADRIQALESMTR